MSVIVLTPGTSDTIQTSLRYLQNQSNQRDLEIVIVAPSIEVVDLDSPELHGFASVQVVPFPELLSSTAAARAAAVRAARGSLIAFIEDHFYLCVANYRFFQKIVRQRRLAHLSGSVKVGHP